MTPRDGSIVYTLGTLVLVAGDNLGLNQLSGFVESFSAIHFCRLRMAEKDVRAETYRGDNLELRTTDQCTEQLKGLQEGSLTTRDCGIKNS